MSVGTPIAKVSFDAGFAKIPLSNTRTQYALPLEGVGLGGSLGVGVGVLGPVTLSGSLDEFPADGIGKIIKGNASQNRNLVESDFLGTGVVLSAAAGSHAAGSISAVMWLQRSPQQCEEFFGSCSTEQKLSIIASTVKRIAGLSYAATSPAGMITYLASQTTCIGLCTGMELSTDILHAGLTAQYFMFQKG